MKRYTFSFIECSKKFLQKVGSKNANIGELIKIGVRVPDGFAISTDAFKDTFKGVKKRIDEVLFSIDVTDIKSLNEGSKKIRKMMERIEPSREIKKEIKSNLEKLGGDFFAIRSSAIAEDLPSLSFAGLFDSYLWVKEEEEVLKNVKKCWSSLFTPRAIAYRSKNKIRKGLLMSVGVQKMVNARASGVIFTLNPVNGNENEIIIEANFGVSGAVKGDSIPARYVINKQTDEITESRDEVLNQKEIKELVKLAKIIEHYFGEAQDIEWAIDKNLEFPANIFILQSRPETIWSKKSAKEKILNYIANMFS